MTLVCARRPGLCRVVSVSDNQVRTTWIKEENRPLPHDYRRVIGIVLL